MDGDQALSQALISWSFAFMMVLCRCGAAIMILPGLSSDDGPPQALRMGIALALTVLLVPVVAPLLPQAPPGFPQLAGLLMGELVAGFFLGWLARLVALALPAAGQMISLSTGLSSILQPDQNFGAQTAGVGLLFGVAMPVLIFATGLYALPLQALAASYSALPPGLPLVTADITQLSVQAVSAHMALAVRLAAPFMLASTVWHAGLGLLSRLVPQIQVYFAAIPGQVLGGLLLLSLLAAPLARTWLTAAADAFAHLPGS